MQGVTVVDHPLVQHKLTLMRDKTRSTKGFRQLLNEIGMLLAYEVTRDLELEMIDIETPMEAMKAPVLAGKKLVLAPILRAGVGFLDGMLTLVPSARVAHVALSRPEDAGGDQYFQGAGRHGGCRAVLDPMLATASSRLLPWTAKGGGRQKHPLCVPAGGAGGHREIPRPASGGAHLDRCGRQSPE